MKSILLNKVSKKHKKVIFNLRNNKIKYYYKNNSKYYKEFNNIINNNLKNRGIIRYNMKNKLDDVFKEK
jgi:hypothetical protein